MNEITIKVTEYEELIRNQTLLDVLFAAYMNAEKPKYTDETGLYKAMEMVFGAKPAVKIVDQDE